MDKGQLRNILLKGMLGCLLVAAGVAIIAILIGNFDELTWRSLGTVFSAVIHIFVLLALLTGLPENNPITKKSSNIVLNATIVIVVLSFFNSVFSIWGLLDASLTGKLFMTFVILLVAIVHAKALEDVCVFYAKLSGLVYANFAFILLVAGLLLGLIYFDSYNLLEGFYGRLLAVSAIVDVTLGIVIAVMQRFYVQKHPDLFIKKESAGAPSSSRVIVAIFLFLLVSVPILALIFAFAH